MLWLTLHVNPFVTSMFLAARSRWRNDLAERYCIPRATCFEYANRMLGVSGCTICPGLYTGNLNPFLHEIHNLVSLCVGGIVDPCCEPIPAPASLGHWRLINTASYITRYRLTCSLSVTIPVSELHEPWWLLPEETWVWRQAAPIIGLASWWQPHIFLWGHSTS